jgi:hypothetical protein
MKRVRAGSVYVYNPCGWDIFDPRTGLEPGTSEEGDRLLRWD